VNRNGSAVVAGRYAVFHADVLDFDVTFSLVGAGGVEASQTVSLRRTAPLGGYEDYLVSVPLARGDEGASFSVRAEVGGAAVIAWARRSSDSILVDILRR
jgi:hypothetical protein